MLNHSNLEDYADPILYDAENAEFEPQGPFYLALAQEIGGPILEIGCGTGRITIPLAQAGVTITGLDVTPPMIEQARRKAAGLPIQWAVADARTFHLDTQFRLIYATTGIFQHLLTRPDQEAALARVREHLTPEGRFVVDTHFPQRGMMTNVDDEHDWFTYTAPDGRTIRVSGTEQYDAVRQLYHETAYRRWRDAGGQEIARRARMVLRYFFPQEMEALLHYNGFEILERYGDWDHTPLVEGSEHMIYICRGRD